MDKRKSIKTAAAVLTAVALCVSSVAAYQRLGNTYVPSDQKRDLQTNQVLFPEDKDTQNSDSGTQEDQLVPDAENQNSLTINTPNTDTDPQPPQQSNAQQTTVQQPENGNTQTPGYDIIDDKDNADIIINNPTQVPNPLPSNGGNNNNGDSNTPGEDNNGTNPGGSTAEPARRQTRHLFRSPQLRRMKRKNRSLPLPRLRHLHRVRQIPQRILCS